MDRKPRCGARTRSGHPCRSLPVRGKRRCRMHGGAAGSGAPIGNKNALRHGHYSAEAIAERRALAAVDIPPPRDSRFGSPLVLSRVHWVRPELVAEVKFLTWTEDNLMRQVVYEGLREDKPPKDVRRPIPHLQPER